MSAEQAIKRHESVLAALANRADYSLETTEYDPRSVAGFTQEQVEEAINYWYGRDVFSMGTIMSHPDIPKGQQCYNFTPKGIDTVREIEKSWLSRIWEKQPWGVITGVMNALGIIGNALWTYLNVTGK